MYLSSLAFFIKVEPSAQAPARKTRGISSIADAIRFFGTSIPIKSEDLTDIDPILSLELNLLSKLISISAFINFIISINPIRVGFSPTLFIFNSLFFEISPANMRNEAEDKSPGTYIYSGEMRFLPSIDILF